MQKKEINRQYILSFHNAVSGIEKTEVLMSQYASDPRLIAHFMYLENLLPKFKLFNDEITSEDDRVIVKARIRSKHSEEISEIKPTGKLIEIPLAIGYVVENDNIVNHWLIID